MPLLSTFKSIKSKLYVISFLKLSAVTAILHNYAMAGGYFGRIFNLCITILKITFFFVHSSIFFFFGEIILWTLTDTNIPSTHTRSNSCSKDIVINHKPVFECSVSIQGEVPKLKLALFKPFPGFTA